jgi:hypothetical protein
MFDNRIWGRPARQYLIALGVVLWLFALIYALAKNPSAADTGEKMTIMQSSMARLLLNEGSVVYRNENAKFGSALLSVLVRADSWSQELRDRNTKTLIDLGWQQVSTSADSFCNQSVLAEIRENVGDYKSIPTARISMRYNATTIKTCK